MAGQHTDPWARFRSTLAQKITNLTLSALARGHKDARASRASAKWTILAIIAGLIRMYLVYFKMMIIVGWAMGWAHTRILTCMRHVHHRHQALFPAAAKLLPENRWPQHCLA